MPITLIVADGDTMCPAKNQDLLAARMPTVTRHVVIADAGHEFFVDANSQEYINLLKNEVSTTIQVKKFDEAKSQDNQQEGEGGVTKDCSALEKEEDIAVGPFASATLSVLLASTLLILQ